MMGDVVLVSGCGDCCFVFVWVRVIVFVVRLSVVMYGTRWVMWCV